MLFQQPGTGNIGIGPIPGGPSEPLDVWGQISTYKWYDINERRIVSVHTGPPQAPNGSNNLFLGWLAGGTGIPPFRIDGALNTFTGFSAGFNNASARSVANTYNGTYAGWANVVGHDNTMVGANSGFNNITSFNTCVGSNACSKHNAGDGGTYVGNAAGVSEVAGIRNSFFGDASGANNVGDLNTFLGDRAGFNNNGSNNIFSGYQSGFGNHGSNNTFSGYQSGLVNNADGNSFYGYQTGLRNLTGSQNAFFGNWAGINNTIGHANTFSGNGAGFQHIDGDQDTFVGTSAGFNDYHGKANTFVGASAGQDNDGPGHVSGNLDTYVGVAAGINLVGSSNTFIGNSAGFFLHTGDFNTFSGVSAGFNSVGGSYNSYYGYIAGNNAGGGSYNSYYGYAAGNANVTGGSSNVYLANFGANENNTMRIGMRGIGNQLIHTVFFDPILENPTLLHQVVTISNTGQLGVNTIPGGGNVMGSCLDPLSGGTYLTGWVGPGLTSTVGCSFIFQQAVTNNIGIGTTNPSAALDVNGDISAKYDPTSYQIAEKTVLQVFGTNNLAVGVGACSVGGPGNFNTCVGASAGSVDAGGYSNTFVGAQAGGTTVGGHDNTCVGLQACLSEIAGNANVSVGASAGRANNNTGNVFVGQAAGYTNTGTDNIFIGFGTDAATASASDTILIGTQGLQTATYIAGIYGANSLGIPVYVNSSGRLGTTPSSRRFKEQIADMGDSSSKLFQLRPVTFFYKPQYDDGSHLLQYGLIAEEVAKVYPEMVAYEKDGTPYTVKYQLLAPLLLNELQKQHTVVAAQQDELQTQLQQIKTQQQQMQAQRQEIDGLKLQLQQQNASLQERLSKLESYVATQMKTASDNPPRTTPGANGGLQ
jgi:hypothetical protein